MPQLSLPGVPSRPTASGVRITITDDLRELDPALSVGAEVRVMDGDWYHARLVRWTGIQSDFLSTLAEDVVSAYLYGDSVMAVGEAYDGVMKLARAHQRRYER